MLDSMKRILLVRLTRLHKWLTRTKTDITEIEVKPRKIKIGDLDPGYETGEDPKIQMKKMTMSCVETE